MPLHITDRRKMENLFYQRINYDIMGTGEEKSPV